MAKKKSEGFDVDAVLAPVRKRKTSRELRAASASKGKTPQRPQAPAKPQGRPMTVEHWARGRQHDALVIAFVSEHGRQRTVKRTPSEWMNLFREWLKQPR